jgi:NADH-quinone oxidoreductase subunit N
LPKPGMLLNEMFHTNARIIFEKNILNLGTLIISLQSYHWLKKHQHLAEFYLLLLSTLQGMYFMLSAGNLLIFYLGLELSTIPLAALANFDTTQRKSSEAAVKFIMSSAFSSALLLFGISLVYGSTGSIQFSVIAQQFNGNLMQLFAFILLLAAFGFKVSAVPFHLWTADVYQGAPTAVTAYLSVVSKAAILFVLVPVLYAVFKSIAGSWYNMLVLLAIITITIGNLFAIRQDNFKRFMAFSSIAQVGFILVAITGSSANASAAVIYFILIYSFSNLAAFGVIALVSAIANKENISDYKGFYASNPMLSWILAISLFSLAGIPPTAGFFGKFFMLFAAAAKGNYLFITIAALNMIISFYYYLRIIKAIFMDENVQPIQHIPIPIYPKLAFGICIAGIVLVGFLRFVFDYIQSVSVSF